MSESFVVRGASVLDEGGGFDGPLDVHVEDGVVVAVGENLSADAPSLDFARLWLMPGVFDCHVHLGISSVDALECLRKPITLWALEAARNARATLEAGVTSARDAGGFDAGLRAAVDRGLAAGPRTQISVVMLSQTGGRGGGVLSRPRFGIWAGHLPSGAPPRRPGTGAAERTRRRGARA